MSRLAPPSSDMPASNRMSAAQFRELNSQAAKSKKGRNGKIRFTIKIVHNIGNTHPFGILKAPEALHSNLCIV